MRENLRRRFPDARGDEIEQRLRHWLLERPGAEQGDAVGRGSSVVGPTVITLDAILRRIVADLAATSHARALVGGLAVSVRTEPRFTRDADLAVAVTDDADAEALVMARRDDGTSHCAQGARA
jgi:hypothetical protein